MALIKCSECGKEISSNAAACPNCGNPVPKKKVPVKVSRASAFGGGAIRCNLSIDNQNLGDLLSNEDKMVYLEVGSHSVIVDSIQTFGYASKAIGNDGQQFMISDSTNSVSVYIRMENSLWRASRWIVDSISME